MKMNGKPMGLVTLVVVILCLIFGKFSMGMGDFKGFPEIENISSISVTSETKEEIFDWTLEERTDIVQVRDMLQAGGSLSRTNKITKWNRFDVYAPGSYMVRLWLADGEVFVLLANTGERTVWVSSPDWDGKRVSYLADEAFMDMFSDVIAYAQEKGTHTVTPME